MWNIFNRTTQKNDLSWMQVDMHSHMLPALDDGCQDLEQSTALVARLAELGLSSFHFTPHICGELHPNTPEGIARAYRTLQATGVSDLMGGYAAEYMVDRHFDQQIQDASTSFACLPGKHILIEMSYIQESVNIEKNIFDLQIQGYKPILAHPERYVFYHQMPGRIERFKELGCLLQLNLLSLIGYYGPHQRKTALYLLDKGFVDLVGTDVHHERHVRALESGLQKENLSKYFKKCKIKNPYLFSCNT